MTDHEKDRRTKLAAIRATGRDPFSKPLTKWGIGWGDDRIKDVRREHEEKFGKDQGPCYGINARIQLRRMMGKLGFMTVTDGTGEIQVALDRSRLSEHDWEVAKNTDLGDILSVMGNLGATQKGEITIWANEIHVSSKCLTPPPDKMAGLVDLETRYRQRHVDLWTNQDVMTVMEIRSEILWRIRLKMHDRFGYREVETPMMQPMASGAIAKPFKTHHNALGLDLFLRIAPETYLKRLLVGGMRRVFEIGRNFRNEGLSQKHNPEFTSLEAYEAFGDYKSMMFLVEELIYDLPYFLEGQQDPTIPFGDKTIDFKRPWKKVRLSELVPPGLSPEDQLKHYEEHIEPTLLNPTFVTHLPKSAVPLAKESKEFPGHAECFELVIAGMEIAPGYTEENDPDAQLAALEAQAGGKEPVDMDFVEALKCGMPPAGGFGIGIDRLIMLITNQTSIRDVLLFPLLKPEA